MGEQKNSLVDMLDHSPDIMADAKVKVMMSDVYDDMVSYVNGDNARKVAALISNYGTRIFIEWFIDNVYLPKVADVKVMAYVSEHKDDICDILGQAMSNLTAKEVIDNAEKDKDAEGRGDGGKGEDPDDGGEPDEGRDEGREGGRGEPADEGEPGRTEGEPGRTEGEPEAGAGEEPGDGRGKEEPEGGDGAKPGGKEPGKPGDKEPEGDATAAEKGAGRRSYDDELLKAASFVDSLTK